MDKLKLALDRFKEVFEKYLNEGGFSFDEYLNCLSNNPNAYPTEIVEAYESVQTESSILIGSNQQETILLVARWNSMCPQYRVGPGETDSFGWLTGVIQLTKTHTIVFG